VKLKPAVKNYKFSGCLTESSRHRILPGDELATGNMTLEKCADFCKDWPFFGVEYSRECFCGENVARDAKTVSLKQCNAPCAGNSSQVCGGWNRVSVYHDKTIIGPIDPPKIISGGGSSGWVGCYTEASATGGASRTLGGASYASNNMSLKACEKFCISEGMKTVQKTPFKYWGTEYGRECYCGDTVSKGATKVDKRECQQACLGNKHDVCGGALLVSIYQYTGAKRVNSTKPR
ncbi:WSC-domain-containing protein, partial [Thozetella sp. PMI_491]